MIATEFAPLLAFLAAVFAAGFAMGVMAGRDYERSKLHGHPKGQKL